MNVRTIAVVGAGLMGRGIAYVAALGGFRTVVQDTDPQALQKMTDNVSALLERAVAMGGIEGHEAVAAHGRLSAARTLEDAVKDAEVAIEAVPENIRLKLESSRNSTGPPLGVRYWPRIPPRSRSPRWRRPRAARRAWWGCTSSTRSRA